MAAPEIPDALTTWQALGGIVVGIGWGGLALIKFLAGRKEPVRSDMVVQEAFSTPGDHQGALERIAKATEATRDLIEQLLEDRAEERREQKADQDKQELIRMINQVKEENRTGRGG